MARQEKNKQKKPFLAIGLVLLFAALFVGLGFLFTGSIVFARNAIALLLLGGAGVGIATPIVKLIGNLINGNDKQKSDSRVQTREQERTRERDRERTQDLTEEIDDIPVYTNDDEYAEIFEEVDDLDTVENRVEEVAPTAKPQTRRTGR